MSHKHNLFDPLPPDLDGEHAFPLVETSGFRLERIVSQGQATPPGHWYDQPDPEWVMLARGTATLEFADGRRLDLSAGDHLLIPAHQRHRVAGCSVDAVWLALHFREA